MTVKLSSGPDESSPLVAPIACRRQRGGAGPRRSWWGGWSIPVNNNNNTPVPRSRRPVGRRARNRAVRAVTGNGGGDATMSPAP
eukprot:gene8725-15567_t